MKAVFRALGSPPRRKLLDALFKQDGQTLGALERRLPMTRFGVMKHLRVLEHAGLVVTKKRGREKLHFLNPVPIRLVHDRWVSKYAEPWAARLAGLKRRLEATPMEKVFEIYIKTTPERLWKAIVDPEMRRKYNFSAGIESDWTPGSRYQGISPFAPGADLGGREPRGRSTAPARPDLQGALERRREARRNVAGHLGDRADRRFVPADRDPRSAARGRQHASSTAGG